MDCVGLEILPEFPGSSDEGESEFLYVWITSLRICKSSATVIDWELIIVLMACKGSANGGDGDSQIQIKDFSRDKVGEERDCCKVGFYIVEGIVMLRAPCDILFILGFE